MIETDRGREGGKQGGREREKEQSSLGKERALGEERHLFPVPVAHIKAG